MGTLYLGTSRHVRNPVRVQQYNASIRAGDDFKLALTVYSDDAGTPAAVAGSVSQMSLFVDQTGGNGSHDYGWGWFTEGGPRSLPAVVIAGYPVGDGTAGRLNIYIPGAITATFWQRYRFIIQVDLIDGNYTQIEGVLQVLLGIGLVHRQLQYFTLDSSLLDGPDILAGDDPSQVPVDKDGFPLIGFVPPPYVPPAASSNVLGIGILGQMILGGGSETSDALGIGILGQTTLGGGVSGFSFGGSGFGSGSF